MKSFICICIYLLSLLRPVNGSTLIVDTFDVGEFDLAYPQQNFSLDFVSLPLADRRWIDYGKNVNQIVDLRRSLNPAEGRLRFYSSVTALNYDHPASLSITYTDDSPHDISKCQDFILGISEIMGSGDLYVVAGSYSDTVFVDRIPLNGAGDYHYPVSSIKMLSYDTLETIYILSFVFEARSTEFSFTLDEIRLVPEPSTTFTAAVAGMLLTQRPRRKSTPASS